jgi:hypothetical protein
VPDAGAVARRDVFERLRAHQPPRDGLGLPQALGGSVDSGLGDRAFEQKKQMLDDRCLVRKVRVVFVDQLGQLVANGSLVSADHLEAGMVAGELRGAVEKRTSAVVI